VSAVVERTRGGIPVVRLEGDLGAAEASRVETALGEALRSSGGRVLLDLRRLAHLHYRVAGILAARARSRRRLGFVGPTPYVRQILRLVGAVEGEVREYEDMAQALADAVA
jgi:anti-anti-sigma regulatory factor